MSRVAGSSFSEVHLGEQEELDALELDPDRPFKILLAGDFSGRSWRDQPQLSLTPRRIDRDNIDDVLNAMQVSLNLHGVNFEFHEFEDFHPDRIYQSTDIFHNLDQYLNHKQPPAAPPSPSPTKPAASGSLLDQMLEEHEPEPEAPVSLEDAEDLASFIKRVTKGHLEPKPDPTQQQRADQRTALATELLQGFLHHPRMQSIEAAWRAVFMLLRGLETDTDLQLFLLDITLPELVGQLADVQKELRRHGPWALIVGNYAFGQSDLDAQVLERLAGLSSSVGAPFLAEAHLPGETEPGAAWEGLRRSPAAPWIGLALPRFLLRLPYGKQTDSIESFPFEEMPQSEHGSYLWGNPAFFCAYLLGKTFLDRGWEMKPLERRIDGLPMHVYREDGEPVAKPCAEVLMTEKDANTLMEAGFMPVASLKHEPAAMVVRFQSIADPVKSLAGLK